MYYHKTILDNVFDLKKMDFNLLRLTDEFSICETSPENQIFHAETTGEHIQLLIDNLFDRYSIPRIVNEKDTSFSQIAVLYLCSLFHDFRKPQTLSKDEEGIYHNIDHDKQGARYIWDFVYKALKEGFELTDNKFRLINLSSKIISWHMLKDISRLGNNSLLRFITSFSITELEWFLNFQELDHISTKKYREGIDFYQKGLLISESRYKNFNYIPERTDVFLHILVGTPGSGKSTYVKSLLNETTVLISTDEIRKELFKNEREQSKNDVVFGEANQRVKKTLSFERKSVIFDATNLEYELRQNIVNVGRQRKIPIMFHVFLTPLEICLKNNKSRERQIEDGRIKEMYESMENPCGSESEQVDYIFLNKVYRDNFEIYK